MDGSRIFLSEPIVFANFASSLPNTYRHADDQIPVRRPRSRHDACLLPCRGAGRDGAGLESQPSAALIGRAESYIEADTLLDRAVAALSVVANRYYAKPADKAARKDATVAMNQLGEIYSFRFYDFRKAYTNLSTARLIAEEDGDDYRLAEILVGLANIYSICSDKSVMTVDLVENSLRKALEKALSSRNEPVLMRLANNMAVLSVSRNGWASYAGDIVKIRSHSFTRNSVYRDFCLSVIDGMNSYFSGDYAAAERHLRKALESIPEVPFRERYVYANMNMLQHVYEGQCEYAKEEELLRRRLRIVKNSRLGDYVLYTYSHLGKFFELRGEPDSAKKYTALYLIEKERLEREVGMNQISEMEMLNQIGKTNDEIRELSLQRQKERRLLTVAVAVIAVVAVLLIAFVILFFNLKRNHRMLFEKNRELLEREQQLRLLMSHQGQKTQAGRDAEPPRECEADEESARLFPSILKLMEESRDIYRPGFVMDDLCGLLGVPERSVSRAINLCNGTNFHTFLNGYRIREACRLMQDTDPARHTVEHIAASVGFLSRTSFATLFKKTVGLTPSEYWKKARKNGPAAYRE